jgi:hypothetical protein
MARWTGRRDAKERVRSPNWSLFFPIAGEFRVGSCVAPRADKEKSGLDGIADPVLAAGAGYCILSSTSVLARHFLVNLRQFFPARVHEAIA